MEITRRSNFSVEYTTDKKRKGHKEFQDFIADTSYGVSLEDQLKKSIQRGLDNQRLNGQPSEKVISVKY